MNQDDRPAGAFGHKVQPRTVNGNEFREGFGVLMSNAGSEVRSFESAGYVHKSLSDKGAQGNPQIKPIKRR